MYLGGLFTVTEAAGIGAVRRAVHRACCAASSTGGDQGRADRLAARVVGHHDDRVGAYLFGYFLTITQFTQKAVDLLVHLPIGAYGVLALVMLGYLILGAVMDELAMILLTVPIVSR
jgi:C4-dicarboxylate transporter DctM subunit